MGGMSTTQNAVISETVGGTTGGTGGTGTTGTGTTGSSAIVSYQYPAHYEEDSGQWFILNEFNYVRPSSASYAAAQPTNRVFKLPVPPGSLMARYDAEWSGVDLGYFVNSAMNTLDKGRDWVNALSTLKGAQAEVKSVINAVSGAANDGGVTNLLDKIKSAGSDVINNSLIGAADALMTTNAGKMFGIYAGVARNPFVAMSFTGMKLRNFTFEWDFFPESYEESVALRDLINSLKLGMHPSYKSGYQNALFEYPNIYKPEFTDPSFMFSFGYCVITSVSVDYHAKGTPIYFEKNGAKIPAYMKLNLALSEMEIVTKEKLPGYAGFNVPGSM